MANKKNKVKFGLQNVYWAKINEWGEDPDGNKTVPAYGPSKYLPGAVSLSIDANVVLHHVLRQNLQPLRKAQKSRPKSCR